MTYNRIVVLDRTIELGMDADIPDEETAKRMLDEVDQTALHELESVPHTMTSEGEKIIFRRTDAHFG